MMWLVTGGAGYIGSHVARAFLDAGIGVVVIDDLSSGSEGFIPDQAVFERGSLNDPGFVESVFSSHSIAGVVHLAGYKYAAVSMKRPLHTYSQNVSATVNLLLAMEQNAVTSMVFSSSAAVYGTTPDEFVTEQSATVPESPYGETKLIGEWMIADQARATELRHTSLRYFNVVGSGLRDVSDTSPHNLFPLVFRALTAGSAPAIFGDTYATPDGTCIRDWVHVSDVAAAHLRAAEKLAAGVPLRPAYNLGSGSGLSVREIMTHMALVTGIPFVPKVMPARSGDPARIVASGELAARDIGWRPQHTLDDMIASAWDAWRSAGHLS